MDKIFEKYVADAIDHIPKHYTEKMKHVAIVIEDEPSLEQRKKLGLRSCDALFGLYEGVPLPRRGGNTLQIPPDIITIFNHIFSKLGINSQEIKEHPWFKDVDW